jgi:hypothetical protein
MLSCGFALPAHLASQRPDHLQRPSLTQVAFHDAGTAIPALLRVKHDRRMAFGGIGIEHIHGTDLNTAVAAIADCIVENNRLIRGDKIGQQIDFVFGHVPAPYKPL